MDKTGNMVGLLVVNEGKLLLVSIDEMTGDEKTFSVPMGKVKAGETTKDAAVRQLYEEVGLVTTAGDLEEVMGEEEIEIDGESVSLILYRCNHFEGFLFLFGERTTPEWVETAEIANLKFLPKVDDIVKKFLDTANI